MIHVRKLEQQRQQQTMAQLQASATHGKLHPLTSALYSSKVAHLCLVCIVIHLSPGGSAQRTAH